MTTKELYDDIMKQLSNPEFVNRVEEIDAWCEKEKKLGVKFHLQRASNMLQELQDCADYKRAIYESSFDSSVKEIYKLLERHEHN